MEGQVRESFKGKVVTAPRERGQDGREGEAARFGAQAADTVYEPVQPRKQGKITNIKREQMQMQWAQLLF